MELDKVGSLWQVKSNNEQISGRKDKIERVVLLLNWKLLKRGVIKEKVLELTETSH